MKAALSMGVWCALALSAQLAVAAPEYHLEKTHVDVLFSVSHFGFTQKHGSFRDLDAKLDCDPAKIESCRVDVTIRAASIDTGDAARDKDLASNRFFDVAKFPELHFVSKQVTKGADQQLVIDGDLTMHGVTKPVRLQATLNKAAPNPFDKRPTLGFSAKTTLRRSDFGITGLLPMIGDDVTVVIDAEFNRPAE